MDEMERVFVVEMLSMPVSSEMEEMLDKISMWNGQ